MHSIFEPILQKGTSVDDLYWTEEDIDFLDERDINLTKSSVHIALEYADSIEDYVAFRYIYMKNPIVLKAHIRMSDIFGYNVFNLPLKQQHDIFEVLERYKLDLK